MNSNLISKNISGYFDELINKPIINIQPKQSTFTSFYNNYVEFFKYTVYMCVLTGV
jgi:hypothetical protein